MRSTRSRRTSRSIYAVVASGVWVGIGLGFAWMLVGPEIARRQGLRRSRSPSGFLTGVATLLGPIALFWFLALLAWRTEELQAALDAR